MGACAAIREEPAMPAWTGRRLRRRLARGAVSGALGVLVAGLLSGGVAAPSYADDDYPYAGLGQCPLTPPDPPTVLPDGTEVPAPAKPLTCARRIWMVNGSYGDPWGFALRNCTSFVAWRLRETNGVSDFSNHMDGGHWSDARNWDENARALGYVVDSVPAVGAVAQSDAGLTGHVAWVKAVGDGTVTIEEYNHYLPGGYGWRIVPASDFRYIHVKDLETPPMLGSSRAATSVDDARGRTWTARVSPEGDLMLNRPDGRLVRVGRAGSWSPLSAAALAADASGRIWLAAVARDGRLVVRHTFGTGDRLSAPQTMGAAVWSQSSAPSLVVDAAGRLRLIAVTAWGDLFEMDADPTADGEPTWSPPRQLGAQHGYSAQSSPAVAVDATGRLRVAMATGDGHLELFSTVDDDASRWADPLTVEEAVSTTSSPALTRDAGQLWLHAITDRGELLRLSLGRTRVTRTQRLGQGWSPYASPSVIRDAHGGLWVAGAGSDGQVRLLGSGSVPKRWVGAHTLESAMTSVTAGPVVAARHRGGVRVLARAVDGPPLRWDLALPRLPEHAVRASLEYTQ